MVDVDHFKAINDTFGHAAGDHVLVSLARTLTEIAARTDAQGSIVARIGGEEFLCLLRGTHPALGSTIVEAVRAIGDITVSAGSVTVDVESVPQQGASASTSPRVEVAATFAAPGKPGPDTSEHPGVGQAVDSIVHAADRGLYSAKTAGRNRVHHCGTLTLAYPDSTPDAPGARTSVVRNRYRTPGDRMVESVGEPTWPHRRQHDSTP